MWTQNYKEFLEKLYETENAKSKEDRVFLGFKEFHTDTTVHFELEFIPDHIETVVNILKDYHLVTKISLNNMTLYSTDKSIKKYDSAQEIMLEYYVTRLSLYEKRKQHILDTMKNELDVISNTVRFILMVVENTLLINNRKKQDIETDLIANNFPKLSKNSDTMSYDYLLSLPIYQLTFEKIEKLKKEIDEKQTEYNILKEITPVDMWRNELTELMKDL